jgi:hypothetical protein
LLVIDQRRAAADIIQQHVEHHPDASAAASGKNISHEERKVKRLAAIGVFAVSAALAGCSSSQPTNMMENEEQSDIEAYEAAIAEQDAAMEADSGDADIP